jgi:hypothetical protein
MTWENANNTYPLSEKAYLYSFCNEFLIGAKYDCGKIGGFDVF